ncbi:uncharacterized protein LOC126755838 [Bactrocera neohumeralis]|uniref:uncharacterized protein LOC126755838 n=1 Tax=Bactrocera neohumeralis TaxID=98809 RepID=UPI002165E50B|nr:uncharacterized protein LOC126755838 [Bactrocera neohumeralis]
MYTKMLPTRRLVALVAATFTLVVLTSTAALELRTPDLEAFANYDDMRRYIASRNQRSMRYIDNPTEDTYLKAYNDHHEFNSRQRLRRATKAEQARKLPTEPQLVKFEISDALEPSPEVKELIRQHRSREEKPTTATSTTNADEKNTTTSTKESLKARTKVTTAAPKRSSRGARARITPNKRAKRAAPNTPANRQSFNFQVKLIPFDISEAREPDEQTKALIRRMRNLELQKLSNNAAVSTVAPTVIRVHRNAPATGIVTAPLPTFNPGKYYRPKTGKLFMKRKGKRVKRSAPQMIRFELEDAREPNGAIFEQLRLVRQSRKDAKAKDQQNTNEGSYAVINKREARMDTKKAQPAELPVKEDVDEGDNDQSNGESKRTFVYKEAPIVKAKKSISSLPVEVQKIITHLMKDHGAGGGGAVGGGKAYVKYIPAHMVDYRQLKSLYGAKLALPPTYSLGSGGSKLSPASYIKYIPPHQKGEQLQVQIHPVPVVEKIRYIYTPVAAAPVNHGYDANAHAAVTAEEQAAARAAATHAVQAAYAGQNVHAVAEAQAAQAAHAAHAAQAQHGVGVAHIAENYGAKASAEEGGAEDGEQEGGGVAHPIVVQENAGAGHQGLQAAPVAVHHTYAADVSHALQEEVPATVAIKAIHFRPSKPDPLLNENKLTEAAVGEAGGYGDSHVSYGGVHGGNGGGEQQIIAVYAAAHAGGGQTAGGHAEVAPQYVENYKYEVGQAAAQPQKEAEVPLVKIEYHGPADDIKQNFKELPEFKQLSTLVGKSTEDQIHGLTYLLAKEMQNKLKLQRKKLYIAAGPGAHTNTAPIVFPHEQQQVGELKQQQVQANAGGIHGRLIGMAKSKEYIPIVEHGPVAEQKAASGAGGGAEGGGHGPVQHIAIPAPKQYVAIKVEPKAPLPNSFVEYGLSPNYQGIKGAEAGAGAEAGQKTKLLVEQVIHHPRLQYKGSAGAEHAKAIVAEAKQHGNGASSEQSLSYGDELQYAAKYAFGYRIRDFNTGNDFGHKQNRDLDGVTRGQYHILLPDGRIQNVIYHADDTGFHADVSFETGH